MSISIIWANHGLQNGIRRIRLATISTMEKLFSRANKHQMATMEIVAASSPCSAWPPPNLPGVAFSTWFLWCHTTARVPRGLSFYAARQDIPPLKTNMEPKNYSFKRKFHPPTLDFQVPCYVTENYHDDCWKNHFFFGAIYIFIHAWDFPASHVMFFFGDVTEVVPTKYPRLWKIAPLQALTLKLDFMQIWGNSKAL